MVFRQLLDDAPGFFIRPYNSVTDGVQRKGKYSEKAAGYQHLCPWPLSMGWHSSII
jgi:hypothetical protein